jgi:hypothetical protein
MDIERSAVMARTAKAKRRRAARRRANRAEQGFAFGMSMSKTREQLRRSEELRRCNAPGVHRKAQPSRSAVKHAATRDSMDI